MTSAQPQPLAAKPAPPKTTPTAAAAAEEPEWPPTANHHHPRRGGRPPPALAAVAVLALITAATAAGPAQWPRHHELPSPSPLAPPPPSQPPLAADSRMYLVGIGVSLLVSCLSSLGLSLQALALHTPESPVEAGSSAPAPPPPPSPPPSSPLSITSEAGPPTRGGGSNNSRNPRQLLWYAGFGLYVACQGLGSFVVLPFLPAMLVAPLGSAGLVFNVAWSRALLGARTAPAHIAATLLIMAGGAAVSVLGYTDLGQRQSIDELVRLWSRPVFIIYFSLVGALVAAGLACAAILERRATVFSPPGAAGVPSSHPLATDPTKPLNPPPRRSRRTSGPTAVLVSSSSSASSSSLASEPLFHPLRPSDESTPLLASAGSPHQQQLAAATTSPRRHRPPSWLPSTATAPSSSAQTSASHSVTIDKTSPAAASTGTCTTAASQSPPQSPPSPSFGAAIDASSASAAATARLAVAGRVYAAVGGAAASFTLLLAKSAIELLLVSASERSGSQFRHPLAVLVLVLLVVTLVLQMFGLNKAVALASPLEAVPLFFTLFTVLSIADGLVYLDQAARLPPARAAGLAVAVAVLLAGVWALSLAEPAPMSPPPPPPPLPAGSEQPEQPDCAATTTAAVVAATSAVPYPGGPHAPAAAGKQCTPPDDRPGLDAAYQA
ncbi:hypothetical protein HK405_008545 [Cladochytrium tenue]|nr:hypothetical protein HK405_008545 [Cladochytrium tenue]